MFGRFKRRNGAATVAPPVDLNQPVENPGLVAALNAAQRSEEPIVQAALACALRSANFLVPILTDEMITSTADEPGQMTIHAGSRIKVFTCTAPTGAELVPLFTDWGEIRRWIDAPVATLVMPARDAFEFASMEGYAGAVVNPAGHAVELSSDQVDALLAGV
jgi:hypothetical protein